MSFKNSIFLLKGICDDFHKREMIKRISQTRRINKHCAFDLSKTGGNFQIKK
jgi:hypothetical protein